MKKIRIQYSGDKYFPEVERIAAATGARIISTTDLSGAATLEGDTESFSDTCYEECRKSPYNGSGIAAMSMVGFAPSSKELTIRFDSVELAGKFKSWLCNRGGDDFADAYDWNGALTREKEYLDFEYHYPSDNEVIVTKRKQ